MRFYSYKCESINKQWVFLKRRKAKKKEMDRGNNLVPVLDAETTKSKRTITHVDIHLYIVVKDKKMDIIDISLYNKIGSKRPSQDNDTVHMLTVDYSDYNDVLKGKTEAYIYSDSNGIPYYYQGDFTDKTNLTNACSHLRELVADYITDHSISAL